MFFKHHSMKQLNQLYHISFWMLENQIFGLTLIRHNVIFSKHTILRVNFVYCIGTFSQLKQK
jgi:hypothetical protein